MTHSNPVLETPPDSEQIMPLSKRRKVSKALTPDITPVSTGLGLGVKLFGKDIPSSPVVPMNKLTAKNKEYTVVSSNPKLETPLVSESEGDEKTKVYIKVL